MRIQGKSDNENNSGVSPVIGVILMVAVTVALVALVTVTVFDLGGDVGESPDATVQLVYQNGQAEATVLRNENVDKFVIRNTDTGQERDLDGDTGSTVTVPAGEGDEVTIIGVTNDGNREVISQSESNQEINGDESLDTDSGSTEYTVSADFENGDSTGGTLQFTVGGSNPDENYGEFENVDSLQNLVCSESTNGGNDLSSCESDTFVEDDVTSGTVNFDFVVSEVGTHEFVMTLKDNETNEVVNRIQIDVIASQS